MNRSGRIALLVLLAAIACAPEKPVASDDDAVAIDPAVPPRSREVAAALQALKIDSPPPLHINEPLSPTKMYLPNDYYDDCADAIDLLTRTPEEVDGELLDLARSDLGVHVRYRAAQILTARHNRLVIPILAGMCFSKTPEERYVAFVLYEDAIRDKRLPAPKDVSQFLDLYGREKDLEVREQIEGFFGTARAKSAVNALLETLGRDPGATEAIRALGEIRDPRAVPAIIASFPKTGNQHINMVALGKLATSEAIDFLIQHLEVLYAPEGLYATGSAKALPALQNHLDRLKRTHSDDAINIAATRVAIVRLSHKNPTLRLLALAEDTKEGAYVRYDAMKALGEYRLSGLDRRLLQLFKREADWDLRRECVHLLAQSSLGGVTEALVEALRSGPPSAEHFGTISFDYALTDALNKRLKTSFRKPHELREFLSERRVKQR